MRRPRRQLSLFTSDEGEALVVGQVDGVHVPPRPPTEQEVADWLRARGWKASKPKGTKSRVADPGERRRLAGQAAQILALLQERGERGAWNGELADIALKYTSRISEIRGAGYTVAIVERRADGGRRYALKEET